MKLAISGKGGVGKSTLAAALALLLARQGRVLAVDADPDANLASALGVPAAARESIIPIAERKALIEERTGAKVKEYGQIFKLNPEVADIAANFAYEHEGVALLVLGAVDSGGSGCACPENVLLRALVTDLVLHQDEALVMDMEAGVEHLGRSTARGVDVMLIVVEPGRRSLDCARRLQGMARDIGLRNVRAVANKITSSADEEFIRAGLNGIPVIGSIPYSKRIMAADREEKSVLAGVDAEDLNRFAALLKRLEQG